MNVKARSTLKLLHPMYKSFRGCGWHFSEVPVGTVQGSQRTSGNFVFTLVG